MSDVLRVMTNDPSDIDYDSPVGRVMGVLEKELRVALDESGRDSAYETHISLMANSADRVKIHWTKTRNPGWVDPTLPSMEYKYSQPKKNASEAKSAGVVNEMIDKALIKASEFYWNAKKVGTTCANHTLTFVVKHGTITGLQQRFDDSMFPNGIKG
jgi:hypothetical protein